MYEDDCEHPWDQELRQHISSVHGSQIQELAEACIGEELAKKHQWDLYKAALSVQERQTIPVAGVSVDRRVFEYTYHVYNDECIRSLICFSCAQIKVDTGHLRSEIGFRSGRWLFSLPPGSLVKNFSMEQFTQRYRQSGSPLALRGSGSVDLCSPDFSDWQLQLHPQYMDLLAASPKQFRGIALGDLEQLSRSMFLCCPEDQYCDGDCVAQKVLCHRCRILVCRLCSQLLTSNAIIPQGLINDNWQEYIQSWIYEVGVTWMEKIVSSSFWTGLTLFSIGRRGGERKSRRKHLMDDAMYAAERRVAFKGQVFSAPMDWSNILAQLKEMEAGESKIALPVMGEVLQCLACACPSQPVLWT